MDCPTGSYKPCPVWLQVVSTVALLSDSILTGLLVALGISSWKSVKDEMNPILRSLWEQRSVDGEWELWARVLWIAYWCVWIGLVWLAPPKWRRSVSIFLLIVSCLGVASIAFR